jgi:hypothetical protein
MARTASGRKHALALELMRLCAAVGGRYHVHRLIDRYGIDAKLFEWSDEVTADCPRKQARDLYDQCGARCPDLPKVV